MSIGTISRREFARAVSAALGTTLVASRAAWASRVDEADAWAPEPAPERTSGKAIQLSSNENPYGPSKRALAAMNRARKVAARYPDPIEERVAQRIAQLHGVQPENVVLGCGSGEVLRLADMAFLGSERNVVVAEPTFEAVLSYAKVTRAQPVKVPLTRDFRHDLPAMAAACTERTGLVYLCNPNNPTGTIVMRNELADFLGRVPPSTVILVDEAYHHFVEDSNYASAFEWLGGTPNLVITRTFSKIYGMAGMRLGYGIGSRENILAMREHQSWNNVNAAVLEAAFSSLDDAGHVEKQRRMNRETRDWLCRELQREARPYIPSHTNFLMIDVGGDVAPVIEEFGKRNIRVGRKFPTMANWLRVSIGTKKEMEAFFANLQEIVPVRAARAA